MKATSVMLLLNDRTKELYALTVNPSRSQTKEQEKKQASNSTPCYVATGATYQWTYFLVFYFLS